MFIGHKRGSVMISSKLAVRTKLLLLSAKLKVANLSVEEVLKFIEERPNLNTEELWEGLAPEFLQNDNRYYTQPNNTIVSNIPESTTAILGVCSKADIIAQVEKLYVELCSQINSYMDEPIISSAQKPLWKLTTRASNNDVDESYDCIEIPISFVAKFHNAIIEHVRAKKLRNFLSTLDKPKEKETIIQIYNSPVLDNGFCADRIQLSTNKLNDYVGIYETLLNQNVKNIPKHNIYKTYLTMCTLLSSGFALWGHYKIEDAHKTLPVFPLQIHSLLVAHDSNDLLNSAYWKRKSLQLVRNTFNTLLSTKFNLSPVPELGQFSASVRNSDILAMCLKHPNGAYYFTSDSSTSYEILIFYKNHLAEISIISSCLPTVTVELIRVVSNGINYHKTYNLYLSRNNIVSVIRKVLDIINRDNIGKPPTRK
jgi:hypothetical protein